MGEGTLLPPLFVRCTIYDLWGGDLYPELLCLSVIGADEQVVVPWLEMARIVIELILP